MIVLERIIRIAGSQPTNYPIFASEVLARGNVLGWRHCKPLLFRHVRSPPLPSRRAPRARPDLSNRPRRLLGRGRLGPPGRRAPAGAGARAVAQRFDVPLVELDTHELEDPDYLANPTNRCFFCKTELWRRLVPEARARGLAVVCDGTNADDLREHRPGYAAGQAAGVRSPLAEAGLTKTDVRQAARDLGLPVWDAPAAPCLSSRVAYGIPITSQRLAQVERAEAYLRELGVTGDLRVRHRGDRRGGGARIEVEPRWVPWVTERLGTLTAYLRGLGFVAVDVDPRGYRRGSLLAERAERA